MSLFTRICLAISLLACFAAEGAGFDDRYKVRVGAWDGDGVVNDLYVYSERGGVVISIDDITVIVPPPVKEFVLRYAGSGIFDLVQPFSTAKRDEMRLWAEANVDVWVRDVDVDGRNDLELTGIPGIVSGAFDQIVFAGPTTGDAPSHVTAENDKFSKYHADLIQWMLDPNYFERAVKVTGAEPPTRIWVASVDNVSHSNLIAQFLTACIYENPNRQCGVSTVDPASCIQSVVVYDANGVPTGTVQQVNVCPHDIHIYVYIPGSVTLEADHSIYDTDARETAEILERLNDDCPAVIPPADQTRLTEILTAIYGPVTDSVRSVIDTRNSFRHEEFPGDTLFDVHDSSFHHFDIVTKVCDLSEPNCNLGVVRDDVAQRFSVVHRKLAAMFTNIPGPPLTSYITVPPFTNNPALYIIKAGTITQQRVASGAYIGATQNVTHSDHVVYPGLISRYIQTNGNSLEVFTHGIGINRVYCSLSPVFRPIHMLLGFANDVVGPKVWRQCDKEMIKYWNANY